MNKSQPGQTLIIILLVMVLSLATGLAISTRSTSTVHQTANLTASEQALATAESAAEIMLAQTMDKNSVLLNVVKAAGFNLSVDMVTTCTSLPCYKYMDPANTVKSSINVITTPDVGTSSPFEFYLETDDVQQVWLQNSSGNPYNGSVNICWQKASEVDASGLPAALEVKVIAGTSPNYTLNTFAYDVSSSRQISNKFSSPSLGSGVYASCTGALTLVNGQALRIRPLYTGTSVSVSPAPSQPAVPYQGNVITATGYAGGTTRTIQVTKTLPQLPALFDFGVYANGVFSK